MASAKSNDRAAAKKAKQEKILLAVLGVAFVAVFFVMVLPKLTKKPPEAHAATPIATTSATSTIPGSVSFTPAAGSSVLTLHPAAYAAGVSQVGRLSRLQSKDPFAHDPVLETSAEPTPPAIAPRTTSVEGGGTVTSTTPSGPVSLYATISINGTPEVVTVGGLFPAASPLFVLRAASGHWVKIGLAGGTFATGSPTATLRQGRTLTLTNTADGSKYVLKLLGVSTQAPVTSTTPTGTGVLETGPSSTVPNPDVTGDTTSTTPPPPTTPAN